MKVWRVESGYQDDKRNQKLSRVTDSNRPWRVRRPWLWVCECVCVRESWVLFFWLAEKAEVSRPNVLTCIEGDGQTDIEFKNGTWTLLWVRVTRPTHDGATASRIHSFGCGPAKYPIHFQPSNSHPILGVKKTRLDRIQPESSQYKKGDPGIEF